jgi:hypothetical protein
MVILYALLSIAISHQSLVHFHTLKQEGLAALAFTPWLQSTKREDVAAASFGADLSTVDAAAATRYDKTVDADLSTVYTAAAAHYDKTVDVLSFGSLTRPDYQRTQHRTWASHASVRHFFGVTEEHDIDRECTNLANEDIYAISDFCKKSSVRFQNPLKKYQSTVFARKQWLEQKAHPVGWMCCTPRPVLGMAGVVSFYKEKNYEELPSYLLLVDDDTYYNMETFQQHFADRSPDEPEGWAGCLIQHAVSLNNFTFPHGGFGLSLSKAALHNLIEPIHCDNSTQSTSEFVSAACRRLKEPLYNEAQLFQPGMSLLDIMVEYVTFQPYSMYKNWTTGFCQHGGKRGWRYVVPSIISIVFLLTPTRSLFLRLVVGVFLELLQCDKPPYHDTSCRYGFFQ